MRKRVHVVLAVVLVAIAGVIVWQLLHLPEPEPVYHGKRLSFWLSEYRRGSGAGVPEWIEASKAAEIAIRKIGTNGIPALLQMVGKKDSAAVSRLLPFWGRHVQPIRFLPGRIRFPEWWRNQAGYLNFNAALGFKVLSTNAQQAVPALIQLYEQNVTPSSQVATVRALNAIGPEAQRMALPTYLRAATNSDGAVREVAVSALMEVTIEHRQVVPALVAALSDTNWFNRLIAVKALGCKGTNAQQAVPALVPLLSDPDARVRGAASYALKTIDPEAASKAGVK